jgi:hypothetical protein
LVTSNNFCLIKGNGHPYLAIRDKKSWVVIFSTRHNPARIILELIWSKISSHFNAKMPYGLDLDMETIAPLLIAEPREVGEQVGWAYNAVEYKEKRLVREEQTTWEPSKVGVAEMSAINIMVMQGGYLNLDAEIDEYLQKEYHCTLHQVVEALLQTRVFAKDGKYLRPVSSATQILPNDDGGYVAFERDRFDAWCEKNSIQPAYINMLFLE